MPIKEIFRITLEMIFFMLISVPLAIMLLQTLFLKLKDY
jgi:hypothetical protein